MGRLIAPLATAVRFVGQNQAVYIPRSAIDTALDEWIFWNKKTHARLIAKSPRSWVFRACSLMIPDACGAHIFSSHGGRRNLRAVSFASQAGDLASALFVAGR